MIGKNFIFNGNAIPYTKAEGLAAHWYADVDINAVSTRTNITPRQDYHGVRANPTFGEGRLVRVSGEIFSATKSVRGSARQEIESFFPLQTFPSIDEELKVLQFKDDDGSDWFLNCKVYTLPAYNHLERGGPIIDFDFNLYAPDPIIRSLTQESETGNYGLSGGISLPAELPAALSSVVNEFLCTNNGNIGSPATITITVSEDIESDQNIAQSQEYSDGQQPFGTSSTEDAFGFIFTANLEKFGGVTLKFAKEGSPGDAVRVSLYTESGGLPDTLVASVEVDPTSFPATSDYTLFQENTVLFTEDITDGVDYIVIVERTGAFDAVNYYRIASYGVDNSTGLERTSSAWTTWANQVFYRIHYQNSIVNPKILNLTTNRYFQLNRTLYTGQSLVIDSNESTAEVDGVNAMADRGDGSNFIYILPGANYLVLLGDNYEVNHQDMATATVDFYHTRL